MWNRVDGISKTKCSQCKFSWIFDRFWNLLILEGFKSLVLDHETEEMKGSYRHFLLTYDNSEMFTSHVPFFTTVSQLYNWVLRHAVSWTENLTVKVHAFNFCYIFQTLKFLSINSSYKHIVLNLWKLSCFRKAGQFARIK